MIRIPTPYETAVNEASANLALEDPSLLMKRDVLYEKAKEAVRNETSFTFKKGKSRSTLSGEIDVEKSAKRKNMTESFRKGHIVKLMEDIDGKQKEMKFKMLHQSKAQNSKDWETCEKLQKEMNTLRQEVHKSQQELQLLERKEKKSKWYKESKTSDVKEENTSTSGEKKIQKSIFESLNKKTTDSQKTNAKEKETSSQTETETKVAQDFPPRPL